MGTFVQSGLVGCLFRTGFRRPALCILATEGARPLSPSDPELWVSPCKGGSFGVCVSEPVDGTTSGVLGPAGIAVAALY